MALELYLASRGTRFWANFIDNFILGLLVFASQNAAQPIPGLVFLGYMLVQIVLLTKDGQTIGKKIMSIKIVKTKTGKNGGFVANVLLRSLYMILLILVAVFAPRFFIFGLGMGYSSIGLIYLLGSLLDILLIFRSDRRCLHDMIAGTSVVVASFQQQTDFGQRKKAPLATFDNLESFVGEKAYSTENQHYIGKIVAINSEQKVCLIKSDLGGEAERSINEVLVLEPQEAAS